MSSKYAENVSLCQAQEIIKQINLSKRSCTDMLNNLIALSTTVYGPMTQ